MRRYKFGAFLFCHGISVSKREKSHATASFTAARLGELGLEGFTKPIKLSCSDHEGNGPVRIQQWDGTSWNMVSDWITPMRDVVRPMVEAAAAKYAEENGITPRDCSAE